MSDNVYVPRDVPVSYKKLNGGLNSTSGPLGLQDNESSSLLNIDFDKFGSLKKRNGYTKLNTVVTSDSMCSGLFWFELITGGSAAQYAVNITGNKGYKMDSLDGDWDDISGSVTITPDKLCDFTSFLNTCFISNDTDAFFQWDGADGTMSSAAVPTGVTNVKYNTNFQNYLIIANCLVSGVNHPSRFYWSTIKDKGTWNDADFIDISKNDGQEITRVVVLGDRLVVYKTRSIHVVIFTGDRDIPFVVDKTNSSVGCIAPFSVQEVENGHVFLSYDGLYYFDGNNSFKISDKINNTMDGLSKTRIASTVSLYQRDKNRYWLSVTDSGDAENLNVITWDSFNNAFSIYDGTSMSAGAIFMVNGVEERPYFGDSKGVTYRADTGTSDNPSGGSASGEAINGYYYTNWKDFDDLVDVKGVPHTYIYYQIADTDLTFAYSYDFEDSDTYTQTVDLSSGGGLYGSAIYGLDVYGASGGRSVRRDLTGRGRTIRVKFANDILDDVFQIDGIGIHAHLETQA